MDVGRRAKQFAPFAALRGLDETIRQLLYVKKQSLSSRSRSLKPQTMERPMQIFCRESVFQHGLSMI